ncbi:hypothetical protein [Halosimplex sp. J119]
MTTRQDKRGEKPGNGSDGKSRESESTGSRGNDALHGYGEYDTVSGMLTDAESNVRDQMSSDLRAANPNHRRRVIPGLGTGASRFALTMLLNFIGRELIKFERIPPAGGKFDPQGRAFDGFEFLIMDSTGEDRLRGILEHAIKQSEAINVDEDEKAAEMVDYVLENVIETFVIGDGRGTNQHLGLASFARYAENFEPVAETLNGNTVFDAFVPLKLGGGTSTAFAATFDAGLRDGAIPSAEMGGHSITLEIQMPSITDSQEVQTVDGSLMTNQQQAFETFRSLEGLREDRLVSRNYVVSKDHMAISGAAARFDWTVDEIVKHRGSIHESTDWTQIDRTVSTNREIREMREPGWANLTLAETFSLEHIARDQPEDLYTNGREADMDPADIDATHLAGETFVPASLLVRSEDDLAGRHPAIAQPDGYEESLTIASRLLPYHARGPVNTEALTDIFVVLVVGGSQDPIMADIDIVESNLAAELGVDKSMITTMIVEGATEYDVVGGPSWISLGGFFGIDNAVDSFKQFG